MLNGKKKANTQSIFVRCWFSFLVFYACSYCLLREYMKLSLFNRELAALSAWLANRFHWLLTSLFRQNKKNKQISDHHTAIALEEEERRSYSTMSTRCTISRSAINRSRPVQLTCALYSSVRPNIREKSGADTEEDLWIELDCDWNHDRHLDRSEGEKCSVDTLSNEVTLKSKVTLASIRDLANMAECLKWTTSEQSRETSVSERRSSLVTVCGAVNES